MRAFIAIDVPEEVKGALRDLQRTLASSLKDGIRWVDPYSTHLTVKFLGEIERSLIPALQQSIQLALQDVEEVEVEAAGLGTFPDARAPRVLWVGLRGNVQVLTTVQKRLDEELVKLGLPPEKRPFSPHLTLGRISDRASKEVASGIGRLIVSMPASEIEFTIKTLSLMESNLTPRGAQYTRVFTHRFKNKK